MPAVNRVGGLRYTVAVGQLTSDSYLRGRESEALGSSSGSTPALAVMIRSLLYHRKGRQHCTTTTRSDKRADARRHR